MSSQEFGIGGWLRFVADDTARTVTEYEPDGTIAGFRRYSAIQNQTADYEAAQRVLAAAQLALDRALFLLVPTELDAVIAAQSALSRRSPGDSWETPDDVAHSYPLGWRVQYDGQTWESTLPANIWTPGVQGWITI